MESATIDAVEFLSPFLACITCSKKILSLEEPESIPPLVNCPHCKSRQKATACRRRVSGKVSVSGDDGSQVTVTLFEQILQRLLNIYNAARPESPPISCSSLDDASDALLLLGAVELTYNNNEKLVVDVNNI
jgi:hypothetical protein